MKLKITFIIAVLFVSLTSLMAQSPNMINYQGVAHNVNGTAIANQNIKVRLKIHQGTAQGTIKYSEVRSLTTDASGLFNIQIGSAGAVSTTGSWAAIAWESGAKYLQVEMDATGGSNFVNMGTQQMLSVPYAQHAKQADALVLPYSGVVSSLAIPCSITNNHTDAAAHAIKGNANGGIGVIGSSLLANGVKGTSSAAYYGAVEGVNSVVGGKGVVGIANTGTNSMGVEGNANAGIGVSGYSNTNIGVQGGSISGTGVYGNTLTGSAIKGISSSGYGLEISGKVKIAGGNTTPGAGKVLTSDASGNATWQTPAAQPKVAFKAEGATSLSFAHNTLTKMDYQTEQYDLGNNYQAYAGSSTGTSSVFTAPVNGVYHFSAGAYFDMNSSTNSFVFTDIYFIKETNGTQQMIANRDGYIHNSISYCTADLEVNTDIYLVAGQKVFVQLKQYNGGSSAFPAATNTGKSYFTGHLVTTY